ncbi:hypothetical protein [Amycolatopsis sp. PS_44_ISF1]|uniref:hypothetical protein n=1 Tax=Amycolatopsis sp. PS_44_ISF1 TaxID=2974917 RepID=UPI0028DE2DE8|nr:hypothetical protein [Amycolatopsis sp. PS_44_ISF1]MDT8914733.1 hypothetical protein [Amycolatopsis sp. PS_44_ISF1]
MALVVADGGNYVSAGLSRQFAPITMNHTTTTQHKRIGPELSRLIGHGTVAQRQ